MSRIHQTKWRRYLRAAAGALATSALAEAALIRLGQTYGSVPVERAMPLLGDDIVPDPQVVTNHAIDIDAPPDCVWPWLVQMGWHRAGWYTAHWVDQLLFPLNWPSANRIIPQLQHIDVGDFIPDGAPATKCGLIVEQLERGRAMALHSTSHLPASWRDKASLDWSWAFVLLPMDGGRRTRFSCPNTRKAATSSSTTAAVRSSRRDGRGMGGASRQARTTTASAARKTVRSSGKNRSTFPGRRRYSCPMMICA